MRVTVVGAGVIGLVNAVRLAEAGHEVIVVAEDLPAHTTSAVAAALWYPYRAYPEADVTAWSAISLQELSSMDTHAGVRMRWGRELLRDKTPDPWWRAAAPALDRIPEGDLPEGYADGWRMRLPVIDMPQHLAWLEAQVRIEQRRVTDLSTLDGDAIVNCTGLGARELTADEQLVPVRGQVVVVEQFGLDEWVLDQSGLTYVIPRENTVILGGTAQENANDLTPNPATAAAILTRCAALVPEVAHARIVEHKVGLRPARPTIRLESGLLTDGRPVVHSYGHGGAGVTLAYGCARTVVALVASLSRAFKNPLAQQS